VAIAPCSRDRRWELGTGTGKTSTGMICNNNTKNLFCCARNARGSGLPGSFFPLDQCHRRLALHALANVVSVSAALLLRSFTRFPHLGGGRHPGGREGGGSNKHPILLELGPLTSRVEQARLSCRVVSCRVVSVSVSPFLIRKYPSPARQLQ